MNFEAYMKEALTLASIAAKAGDVPVGCVIADENGKIIGRGHNTREQNALVTSHAEITAMENACKSLGDWRLDRCTLFVTVEPCPMCAGAMINARLSRLVYGAREPLFGSCASVLNLFAERYPCKTAIFGGVLEEECAALMSRFFEERRRERPHVPYTDKPLK